MGRIRTVKPEFFRHELLNELETSNAELRPMLTFAGLWTVSDKNGTFIYNPRTLKLDILPYVEYDRIQALGLLCDNGFIKCFVNGGKMYGYIPSYLDHQRITGTEATGDARYPSINDGNSMEATWKQYGSNMETVGKQYGRLESVSGSVSINKSISVSGDFFSNDILEEVPIEMINKTMQAFGAKGV
jgi:hypothetical protein